jgi:Haem-degrading
MPAHGPVAITLNDARTIVEAALEHARSGQYPPMTVAVLDAAGQLVAFAREDGSSLLRGRIARAKARGAPNMGVGSGSLAARAAAHPRSSTQWSPSPMATSCPPPAGCSCATTATTSSARSGSAGPCPTTTKPAQSTASPPRGCALTPERLIQPDPAIPTNRLGDFS